MKFSTGTAPEDLQLPHLRLRSTWSRRFFHLLALGGRRPDQRWFRTVTSGACELWAADAGLGLCLDAGLEPQVVIGDFDSLPERYQPWLESHSNRQVRFPVEKDRTDFQLALQVCCDGKSPLVVMTGCWGGRFDHCWCNVMSLRWGLEQGWNCPVMADEREFLAVLKGGEDLEMEIQRSPKALSLLPLGDCCQGVTAQGLRWELQDAQLRQGLPYSVSNITKGRSLRISLAEGFLGVYLCWDED